MADQPLDAEHGVGGIGRAEAIGVGADQDRAAAGKMHDARDASLAPTIKGEVQSPVHHRRGRRVARPEVDAEHDLGWGTHVSYIAPSSTVPQVPSPCFTAGRRIRTSPHSPRPRWRVALGDLVRRRRAWTPTGRVPLLALA